MATFLSETKAGNSELYKAKESIPEFTSDNILEFPWNLWRDLEKSDSFFRRNLSNVLYYTLQLRFFRNYIQEEVLKNRSRKGAAVKRAYRYSKNDAKKAVGSLPILDLEQLWKIVDNFSTSESKSLNDRLDAVLSKNYFNILKNETNKSLKTQIAENFDSDLEENSENEVSELSNSHKPLNDQENPGKEDSNYSKNNLNDVDDRFFKFEEMEAFADRDFDGEDEIDYFDSLGEESDDSVAAADMKFSDFFKDPNLSEDETIENPKPLTFGNDLEDMDEYDQEMEFMLQKLENEGIDEEEDDDGLYRDEIEEDFGSEGSGDDRNKEDDKEGPLDFDFDNNYSNNNMNQQDIDIARVENELVAPKHWSLMGESTAKDRPRNSLLDLELELPQPSSVVYETQENSEDYQTQQEQLPIEVIITQRIKTGVFDNVERKLFLEDQLEAAENLKKHKANDSNRSNNNNIDNINNNNPSINRDKDNMINEIDFNKNEMGLGEVYAQKYKEQFMAIDKLDSHKKQLSEQFSKLVYKLDSLSNSFFVPKRISESEKSSTVPIISVETPVNLVLSQPNKTKEDIETMKVNNKVSRNTKKRKFKNKMKGLIKSGRLSNKDVEKIKEKMIAKNKRNREDNKSKKETGLTRKEIIKQDIKLGRKLNTTELLCNIKNM